MAHAVDSSLRKLAQDFPRTVRLMPIEDFAAGPHRALIDASAADQGTLIYTIGRSEDDKSFGHRGVAVVIPVEEYRRLAFKAEPTDTPC